MKQILITFSISFLLFTSCCAQKMVQNVQQAKKLEINKERFIGKPLRKIIAQINPKIKAVIGNPDNTNKNKDTYLVFHFVSKDDYLSRSKKGEYPVGIKIFLTTGVLPYKAFPKGGITEWKNEQTTEYGDMLIRDIQILGKD